VARNVSVNLNKRLWLMLSGSKGHVQ